MNATSITPDELKFRIQDGQPIELIDVRTPLEFRQAHVQFARNVPLDQIDPSMFTTPATGENQPPIYILCKSGTRGKMACQKLQNAGITRAVNIDGGTDACEQAGIPIVYGPKTISLERQVRIAAGSLVVLGSLLAWTVHPAFLAIAAFVGAGLVFAGVTDTCGMAMLLAKMPWNRSPATVSSCGVNGPLLAQS